MERNTGHSDTPEIVSHDHTDITTRDKRQWTLQDVPLPGGWHLPSVGAGLCGFAVVLVTGLVVTRLLGLSQFGLLFIILAVLAGLGAGLGWRKIRPQGLRPTTWLLVAADYWLFQPKIFHGLNKAKEPERVTWNVILWEPPQPANQQKVER